MRDIVPASFVQLLQSFLLNSSQIDEVVNGFYTTLFKKMFNKIWLVRCSLVIDKEKRLGISKWQKRSKHALLQNLANLTFPRVRFTDTLHAPICSDY